MATVHEGVDALQEAAGREWLSWTRMADFDGAAPPILVGGEGPYVYEADGTRLLDAMSGLFTTQIGYSHGAELGEAAKRQLESFGFYPNWAATSPAPVELTRRVTDLAPENLTRAFFTSGGSEAVESALKLVRQHWLGRGEPLRRKVIARRGAYHGCTLGALSLTGIPAARAPFEPLFGDVRHAENTDRRNYRQAVTEEEWADAAVTAVERTIVAEGPQTVAAVVVEPVQNAGGCLTPPPGYPQRLRELCDRPGSDPSGSASTPTSSPSPRASRPARRRSAASSSRTTWRRRCSTRRRSTRTASRSAAIRCRAPSPWRTWTSWSDWTCSRRCARSRITSATSWTTLRTAPSSSSRPAAPASSAPSSCATPASSPPPATRSARRASSCAWTTA
jgi:Aminotransferase class-III